MATDATQERILNAAEVHLGRYGFRATSLRGVIVDAGVNAAAIHYHFGSKAALFHAVVMRRLKPLDEERRRRLTHLYADKPCDALTLEAILGAFVRPSFELAQENDAGDAWVKLIGRYNLEPGSHWRGAEKSHRRTLRPFLKALHEILPDLPQAELNFRFAMVLELFAAMLCGATRSRLMDAEIPSVQTDAENVIRSVISFAAGGLRVPLPTDTSARAKARSGPMHPLSC